MADEFLSPGRVKTLRTLLLVITVLAVLLALLAALALAGGNVKGGVVLGGIAAVEGASAWLARTAVTEGAPNARRLSILAGALAAIFSLPLGLFGLLSVIAGLGVLFFVFSPERQQR